MKKKVTLLGFMCLALMLVALPFMAACGAEAPAPATPAAVAPAQPVTLSLATFFGAPSMQVKALDDFAADLERETNGLLKIDIFPGGSLLGGPELKEGCVAGVCDMAYLCQYQPSGLHPATEVLGLPLGAPTGWVLSQVSEDWYREFLPEAEYDGTVVLWVSNVTPEVLMTKGTPVRKLEDLQGLKIRSVGPGADFITALGATAIGVPTPAVYDGIQKGEFDGCMFATEALSSWKIAEVVDYVTNIWQLGKG